MNRSEPARARIELGRLLRPVGIRGEVKLLPSPDFWSAALGSERLLLVSAAGERPVRVTASRPVGECFVLKLAELEDRNGAEALRDAELWLVGEPDVDLPEQPRAWQLAGMRVLLAAGGELGEVLHLAPKPGQALLQVKGGTKVYEIPFVAPILCGIDWEAGTITIDPPDGLLDL